METTCNTRARPTANMSAACLQSLPMELTEMIAAYLRRSDITFFQRTCRSAYYACKDTMTPKLRLFATGVLCWEEGTNSASVRRGGENGYGFDEDEDGYRRYMYLWNSENRQKKTLYAISRNQRLANTLTSLTIAIVCGWERDRTVEDICLPSLEKLRLLSPIHFGSAHEMSILVRNHAATLKVLTLSDVVVMERETDGTFWRSFLRMIWDHMALDRLHFSDVKYLARVGSTDEAVWRYIDFSPPGVPRDVVSCDHLGAVIHSGVKKSVYSPRGSKQWYQLSSKLQAVGDVAVKEALEHAIAGVEASLSTHRSLGETLCVPLGSMSLGRIK